MSNTMVVYKRFFLVMGILSLAAIVLNLSVRRGPVQDAQAVEDIRIISSSVESYYSSQTTLPSDLADIKTSLPNATWQRVHAYQYVPLSANHYRLCATFNTDGSSYGGPTKVMPYPATQNPDPGQHGKGRQCFDFTANAYSGGGPRPL